MAMLWRWPPERYLDLGAGVGNADAELGEHLHRSRVHRLLVEKRHAQDVTLRLSSEQDIAG